MDSTTPVPGQKAPELRLATHLGTDFDLMSYRGKNVVVAFFPLAWTPV